MQKYCYRVSSGGKVRLIHAECPSMAVEKFLLVHTKNRSGSLGLLVECFEMTPGEPVYVSTEPALKRLGLWVTPESSPSASSPS